jgi:hypothetical protein
MYMCYSISTSKIIVFINHSYARKRIEVLLLPEPGHIDAHLRTKENSANF